MNSASPTMSFFFPNLIIILSILMVCSTLNGQTKYLILDEQGSKYTVTQFDLKTEDLYKTDFTIELTNVIFPKQHNQHERILLVTALPDFVSGERWEPIDEELMKDNLIDPETYINNVAPIGGFSNSLLDLKSLNKVKLVKEFDGQLMVSKMCLVEAFEVVDNMDNFFSTFYGQLDLNQKHVTVQEFMDSTRRDGTTYPGVPILISANGGEADNVNGWRRWKEFLSRQVNLNGGKLGYQFWTCAATFVADNYDYHQGIGRFIYMPGQGIIAGSYDFYFYILPQEYAATEGVAAHDLSKAQWDQNILQEKLMIAEGFNIDL